MEHGIPDVATIALSEQLTDDRHTEQAQAAGQTDSVTMALTFAYINTRQCSSGM